MLPFLFRPQQDAFAAYARTWILRQGTATGVRYERESFRLVLSPGGLAINLENLHRDYCAAPFWRRNAVMRHFFMALASARDERPLSREELLASLRPALRDVGYLATVREQLKGADGKPPDLVLRPLAGPYEVQLVVDLPGAMRSVGGEELAAAGVGVDEAHEIALRNLQAVEAGFTALAPGLWASQERDCYDAARLLLLHRVRRLAERAVAVPVHRNELLIADPEIPGALAHLARLAEAHADEDRPIAVMPLQLGPDGWREYIPAADDDTAMPMRRLRTVAALRLYEEQRQRLDAIHARDGIDVFVASFTAVESGDTGLVRSYCVWAPVPSLLPRTDLVACIAREGERPVFYRWDDLVPRCAHLLRQTEDRPPRWATGGVPDAALLAGIEPVVL